MPTQKRTHGVRAKPKPHRKRAGGKIGDTFRARLQELIAETGSQRAFALRLRSADASTTDYSPRVGDWLRGRNLPGCANLQLIALEFDVSVDWLVGFPVERRRTHREPIGKLADALLDHIVGQYRVRRRDGGSYLSLEVLAEALGRDRSKAPSHDPLAEIDAHEFLSAVCNQVYARAEELQLALDVRDTVKRVDKLKELARRIDTIRDSSGDPTLRRQLIALRDELGRVALDSEPLRAVLMGNAIESEVQIAERSAATLR